MLKVRLQRVGRKNDPSFRVVVTDSRRGPKSGNYIENLGSYSPRAKSLSLNSDRIKHWIAMGAQVSDTVHNLLVKEKVIDGKAINVLPKKSPIVKKDKEEPLETTRDDSEESGTDKGSESESVEVKDTPAHASQADSKESEEEPKNETASSNNKEQKEKTEESTKEEVKVKDSPKEGESSDNSKDDTTTSEEKK
ncbi:30S ribosomal protein S16 [Patescibacteria group bacterium]|nr:30S ribosomal protein S16 [Patescibacteria group bacterium]